MSQEAPLLLLGLCIALDADFYYLIRSYAQRSGMRTEYLPQGSESLTRAHELQPAVVFLEYDQPAEMSIWDVVSQFKSDPVMQNIPVVVFSWLDEEEYALDIGVDIFVRKPIMYADFQETLVSLGICQKTTHVNLLDS
jgi:CheY-like chemotaxis protein